MGRNQAGPDMQVGGHAGEVFERPLRKIVINITMSKSKETQCKNLHIRIRVGNGQLIALCTLPVISGTQDLGAWGE